jgi:hypothetical protein
VASSADGGEERTDLGTIFDAAYREAAVVAARNALSVALTSLFILGREIPETAHTAPVAKHLARIDHQLGLLAKLIGVESTDLSP